MLIESAGTKFIKLQDLDIYDVGNKLQLYGAIYSDGSKTYLIPLPDENASELQNQVVLQMDATEMEAFLAQTDVLDVRAGKAILRKSQRQIDQIMAWKVYARDSYQCRYCGRHLPLTVDHVVLWEDGGATVEDNLVSSCRRCNKMRGNMQYKDWLSSNDYAKVSAGISDADHKKNLAVVDQLARLEKLIRPVRSR